MKDYELSILVHPDLEMNPEPAVDKVKKLVESHGGKIVKEINEGKKRLAYQISGQDFAMYYYFDVGLPTTAPTLISNALNINDEVIRYMLVVAHERKAEDAKEGTAEGEEEVEEKEDTKKEVEDKAEEVKEKEEK